MMGYMEALDACTNAELIAVIRRLEERIAALETENAKLRKNSSTSSKPPSSDIVKPPKDKSKGKMERRKIGGQKGHAKHERQPFATAELSDVWEYCLDCCPDCGGRVKRAEAEAHVVQQVEVIASPVRIDEHRGLAYYCCRCEKMHYAPWPAEVAKGGLVGPRLTALVAYLKCGCHASFSTIRKFLRDVMNITLSRGQLAKLIRKVSQALQGVYGDLLDRLPTEARLNVDETGHKENKKRFWTWCFRAELYTLFKIDSSRGSKVLLEVLGPGERSRPRIRI